MRKEPMPWWGVRVYVGGVIATTTWTQAIDADDACKRVDYLMPVKGARYQAEPMSICEVERIWGRP